jgi:hypothetical protein
MLLDLQSNRFFKTKSNLLLYREVDWDPERIPESELAVQSMLGMTRIAQTKTVVDPATGKKRMLDTDLVQRARALGLDDESMMQTAATLRTMSKAQETGKQIPETVVSALPEHYRKFTTMSGRDDIAGGIKHPSDTRDACEMSCRDMLGLLKFDIHRDVSGVRPLSSLNYIWVTAQIMLLFTMIEKELKDVKNPLYKAVYESGGPFRKEKRAGLATIAMKGEDEQCLRIMAKVFEQLRSGFMAHIYWMDLDEDPTELFKQGDESTIDGSCTVM